MNKAKVKEEIKELKKKLAELAELEAELEEEMEAEEEVIDGDAEQLLFDISCLDKTLKKEHDGWIYYINQIDDVKCGEIWKVKTNGEDNQLLLKDSGCFVGQNGKYPYTAKQITDVDGKWIEYCADVDTGYLWHACMRKVTIYGKMDQQISDDIEYVDAEDFMSSYYSDWKKETKQGAKTKNPLLGL